MKIMKATLEKTYQTDFKVGDQVLVSPQVTNFSHWEEATIIEIEENPFVGIVINVVTAQGLIFWEKEDMFKPLQTTKLCMP